MACGLPASPLEGIVPGFSTDCRLQAKAARYSRKIPMQRVLMHLHCDVLATGAGVDGTEVVQAVPEALREVG